MTAKHLFGGAAFLQALFLFMVTATAMVSPVSAVTPTSPAAVGIRGYRRFHANDSYIGTPIPCTYEEKLCFRYNTLFSRITGRCMMTYDICDHVADSQEFLLGSGHLFATCPNYTDPCGQNRFRMAYDGRCYQERVVREVLCGCPARPTRHFLGGGVECRCSAARRVNVSQPQEEGRCRIPDLRFPDGTRWFLYESPPASEQFRRMQCTVAQAECFAGGKVTVRGHGSACHAIHRRGPCPPDHVVALLPQRAEGTCVHERGGCPVGQRRMAFDGNCHKDRDIAVLSPGIVRMTAEGQFVIDMLGVEVSLSFRSFPSLQANVSTCLLVYQRADMSLRPQHIVMPPCGTDNEDLCRLYEVEAEAPLPELD